MKEHFFGIAGIIICIIMIIYHIWDIALGRGKEKPPSWVFKIMWITAACVVLELLHIHF